MKIKLKRKPEQKKRVKIKIKRKLKQSSIPEEREIVIAPHYAWDSYNKAIHRPRQLIGHSRSAWRRHIVTLAAEYWPDNPELLDEDFNRLETAVLYEAQYRSFKSAKCSEYLSKRFLKNRRAALGFTDEGFDHDTRGVMVIYHNSSEGENSMRKKVDGNKRGSGITVQETYNKLFIENMERYRKFQKTGRKVNKPWTDAELKAKAEKEQGKPLATPVSIFRSYYNNGRSNGGVAPKIKAIGFNENGEPGRSKSTTNTKSEAKKQVKPKAEKQANPPKKKIITKKKTVTKAAGKLEREDTSDVIKRSRKMRGVKVGRKEKKFSR